MGSAAPGSFAIAAHEQIVGLATALHWPRWVMLHQLSVVVQVDSPLVDRPAGHPMVVDLVVHWLAADPVLGLIVAAPLVVQPAARIVLAEP